MKKILYLITQSEWGGAQKYVFDLATHLRDRYTVVVACGGWSGELIQRLNSEGIRIILIKKIIRRIDPIRDLLGFYEILGIIAREKPDIIHSNSTKASIFGNIAAFLVRVPWIVFTAHGFVFNEPMSWIKRRFFLFLEWVSGMAADKVIAVSEYDRESALRYGLFPSGKIVTIHNGIESVILSDPPVGGRGSTCDISPYRFPAKPDQALPDLHSYPFQSVGMTIQQRDSSLSLRMTVSEDDCSNLRKEFGIPKDAIIVGTISNLYRTKGIEYFVQAVQRIKDMFPHVYFVIIGDGMLRKEIEGDISRFQLQNRIVLAGFRKDALSLLADMDIFVLSSLKEGLPFSVLEAGSMRKPVIATCVGGIPEIIEHEINGLLVPPADPDALAEAIKKFLYNRDMARAYGERLREKIAREFQFSKTLEETVRVYEKR